ncbi:MAG: hypothetical protein M3Q48_12310 [Actinomycetota bacterium]|nr:hypothetical protein [Actinomycetota bacterium]
MPRRVVVALFVLAATVAAWGGAGAADPAATATRVVGDDVVDTPVEVHGAHDGQHGPSEGHLPGSRRNVELLGRANIAGAAPGRVADVSAFGNYAYLAVRDPEGCSDAGVSVVDIFDPRGPEEVRFIDATEGSQPGEGSQVVNLATPAFTGQVLVFNNELCRLGGDGGVSLWDVTDPLNPVVLTAHAGDDTPPGLASRLHQIHSAFAWQAGDRAFVVLVDNEEEADVDILEITDPRRPVLVSETDLDAFNVLQPDVLGQESFLHDMVVQRVRGRWTMVASYWDGGYVLLDVEDPANPTYIADTTFPNPDTLTGLPGAEGNAHQAEFAANGNYIIAADEDFSPYRISPFEITSGPNAGPLPAGEFGFTVPIRTYPGSQVAGPTIYGGLGCPGSEAIPPASTLAVEPGQQRVVVLLRGGCFFSEKVEEAQQAGYDAVVIANHHAGAAGGEAADAYTCGVAGHVFTPTIGGVCVGHRAFHLLFATTPSYTGDDAPPVGTVGAPIRARSVFDGWGYVRLLDGRTLAEIDAYAIPESLDPAFAFGFGDLSVHEVAVDPANNGLAYLSYYSGGLRVVRYGPRGLQEVGHYVDPAGNNFWGVEVHRVSRPGFRLPVTLILASDRDSGLWIFRYTGG